MEAGSADPPPSDGEGKDPSPRPPSNEPVRLPSGPDDSKGKQVGNGGKRIGSGKKVGKKSNGRSNPALQALKQQGREAVQRRGVDDDLAVQIAGMTLSDTVSPVPTGTGLVYDERLTQHACPFNTRHFISEHSDRILLCHERLQHYKLVERCTDVPVRLATEEEILSLHSAEYLDSFKSTAAMQNNELKSWAEQFDSVFVNNHSYECACLTLGGLLDLTEKVVKGELRNGITLTRPCGHHAQKTMANGYSFFNNVAIAAHMARRKWNCERVLIVDWDVHHGQGVQYFFEEDPSVLYISIHRFERLEFWPHLSDSDCDVFGKGNGLGYNVNVPWNKVGMSDSEYLAVFQQLILPMAYEFNPDLILVCCGFDSAVGDPKGEMRITPVGYAHLTHALMGLAGGKLVLALEGGYNFRIIGECAAMCTQTLLGDPCPLLPKTTEPDKSAVETILDVIKNIKPYWKSLKYQVAPEHVQSEVVTSTTSDKPVPQAGETDQLPEGGTTQKAELAVEPDQAAESVTAQGMDPGGGTDQLHASQTTKEVESAGVTDQSLESVTTEGVEPVGTTDQSPVRVTAQRVEPEEIDSLIDRLISEVVITTSKHRTCLVYDEEMKQHKTAFQHPERPDRISRIFSKYEELGLVQRCQRVKSRRATREELHQCHSAGYIERLQAMQSNTPRELYKMQDNFISIYLHQSTYDCASLAVGSTLNVVDAVLSGEAQNGVAIVRPPGHHAESHTAMGFCFFNTVAIAARYAKHKFGLKRVLILDWDVHHGNGTQHAFEADPSVLYISLHRYENGMFFPGSPEAGPDRVGQGPGEGYNVNIAWNVNPMGDSEYIAAFVQVVMPIAYEFSPELVLVSAGFDAAHGDPLGGYNVTPEGYAHMTHMLSSLANGRVVLALEGGYNLNSISESMAMCTKTLLGDPCPRICPGIPCQSAVKSILETLHAHGKYWKSLKYQVDLPCSEEGLTAEVTSSEAATICSPQTTSGDEGGKEGGGGDTDNLRVSSSKEGEDPSSRTSPQNLPAADGERCPVGEPTLAAATASPAAEKPGEGVPVEELGAAGGVDPPDSHSGAKSTGNRMTFEDVFGPQAQLFAVVPLSWCPHLESHVLPIPETSPINTTDPCSECGDTSENWVCLYCYQVLCGRYVNEHMLFHSVSTSHLVVLSYADLSVWCYGCDHYVHHEIVFPAKRAAHISKFGCDDPGL